MINCNYRDQKKQNNNLIQVQSSGKSSFYLYNKICLYMTEHKHGCCPPGSWPALHVDYKPHGQTFNDLGFPVYHIGSGSRVIVIFTDIFGAFTGRHQHVADTFASWGYNVYLPEILPLIYTADPTDMNLILPYITGLDQSQIRSRFAKLVELLEKEGHKQYFGVGFCWGVWKAFTLAAEFKGFISIVGFHPSIICEVLMGGNEAQLTEKVQAPSFFYPAGNDLPNIKTGGELVNILQSKFGSEHVGTLQFPEMIHGWVVRGDLSQENVARDTRLALEHARDYLAKFKI